jgi:PAS domain S-box-containing protein
MRERTLLERLYIDPPIVRSGSAGAYILGALAVAAATVARLASDPWISGGHFIFFFPAIGLTTFFLGVRAGAFAVILSALSAFYFIMPPRFSFQVTGAPEISTLVVFTIIATGDFAIVGLLRTALARLAHLGALDAAIFDSNPDAIIVTDDKGRIVQVNQRAESLFGYSSGALLNQPIEILIPEYLRTRHVAHRGAFAAAPCVREMGVGLELLAQRANGETFPVSVQIGPVSKDGEARMIATLRDVTEQKAVAAALAKSRQQQAILEERQRGAEELRQANETLSAIIESAPVAIWAIGADERITIWNPAVAELYGLPATEAIGRSWRAHIVRPLPPNTYTGDDLIRIAREKGGFRDIEIRRYGANDAILELHVSAAVLHERGGSVAGVLFIAHDIGRTKELESKLLQAQKMEAVGQLTGGIAHDFNNLLAVIYGNLEALEDDSDLKPEARLQIEGGLQAARHGASLTRRLLAFSRQQKLEPTDVDVGALVTGTTDMLRRMVEESVAIVLKIASGLWKTRIDPEQLTNALINLVVNARDAMPDGGTLTVTADNATIDEDWCHGRKDLAPGAYVSLSISDTGAGMTKEVLTRALEPFFTTKPLGHGTGLGLSMVYGFIHQSGGHMTLYSEPGHGTTITLYLPKLEAESPTAPAHETSDTPSAAGEVVLLVEDDEMVRGLQVQSLHKIGYQTLEAEDGPTCLDIIRSSAHVDLMLTDIVLPNGMSGPALAEAARMIRPDLKVVFMSGYAPETVLSRYDLTGARTLTKPFTRLELAQAIHAGLHDSKTAQ